MANNIAQIAPYQYVYNLFKIEVPGYSGYPGGIVSITSYLSANTMFGGANKAMNLLQTLKRTVKTAGYGSYVVEGDAARVFTGQGSIDQFVEVFIFMNENKRLLQQEHLLKPYFAKDDWIQAMIDDHCFGQDCIGFMGTYLAEANVDARYVNRRPLDYASVFIPVKTLEEVEDRSVVMLTNGMHVQIIDQVIERSKDGNSITVDLCQSSKGGAQLNGGVRISAGGGNYLDVDKFRAALQKWKAENPGKSANEYEAQLRSSMTVKNFHGFGYMGGAIFQLSGGGEPANPVSGSVYIGTMPGGLKLKTP